jgi:hypothetical protein
LIGYIDSAKDIIYARSIVNSLLEKCQLISRRMEQQVSSLVESAANKGDDDNGNTMSVESSDKLDIKAQPKLLNKK